MSGFPSALVRFDRAIELAVEDRDFDDNGHIDKVGVARLLHLARREWLVTLDGRPPGYLYVVRRVEIEFVAEGLPGAAIRAGVRARSRGRTSITLDQTLCADDRVMATATAVHVCFDREDRRPVDLWPAVLASIEARQGGPVPVVAR